MCRHRDVIILPPAAATAAAAAAEILCCRLRTKFTLIGQPMLLLLLLPRGIN